MLLSWCSKKVRTWIEVTYSYHLKWFPLHSWHSTHYFIPDKSSSSHLLNRQQLVAYCCDKSLSSTLPMCCDNTHTLKNSSFCNVLSQCPGGGKKKRNKTTHLWGFEICDSHILRSRLEIQQGQQSCAFRYCALQHFLDVKDIIKDNGNLCRNFYSVFQLKNKEKYTLVVVTSQSHTLICQNKH